MILIQRTRILAHSEDTPKCSSPFDYIGMEIIDDVLYHNLGCYSTSGKNLRNYDIVYDSDREIISPGQLGIKKPV